MPIATLAPPTSKGDPASAEHDFRRELAEVKWGHRVAKEKRAFPQGMVPHRKLKSPDLDKIESIELSIEDFALKAYDTVADIACWIPTPAPDTYKRKDSNNDPDSGPVQKYFEGDWIPSTPFPALPASAWVRGGCRPTSTASRKRNEDSTQTSRASTALSSRQPRCPVRRRILTKALHLPPYLGLRPIRVPDGKEKTKGKKSDKAMMDGGSPTASERRRTVEKRGGRRAAVTDLKPGVLYLSKTPLQRTCTTDSDTDSATTESSPRPYQGKRSFYKQKSNVSEPDNGKFLPKALQKFREERSKLQAEMGGTVNQRKRRAEVKKQRAPKASSQNHAQANAAGASQQMNRQQLSRLAAQLGFGNMDFDAIQQRQEHQAKSSTRTSAQKRFSVKPSRASDVDSYDVFDTNEGMSRQTSASTGCCREEHDKDSVSDFGSSETDERGDRKRGALQTSRAERLDRIRKLSLVKWTPTSDPRMRNVSEKERKRLAEAFQRYDYDHSGALDGFEFQDAIADLGLKPMCRGDRKEIARILQLEGGELDFVQFCTSIGSIRGKIQDGHREAQWKAFNRCAQRLDGELQLSMDKLVEVCSQLGLNPECDEERMAFLNAVVEADVDGSGSISWAEFQPMTMLLREQLYQCRRSRELDLCDKLRLNPDVFMQFRSILLDVHDSFVSLDTLSLGAIEHVAVFKILVKFDYGVDLKKMAELCYEDPVLAGIFSQRSTIGFPLLLNIMQRLRDLRHVGGGEHDLRAIFESFDLDQSGALYLDEVFVMLRDLGVRVGDHISVDEVEEMFNRTDDDSSGCIDYEEFQQLYCQICEVMGANKHREAKAVAKAIGLNEEVYWDLHQVYATIDAEGCGSVSSQDLYQMMVELGNEKACEIMEGKKDAKTNARKAQYSFEDFLNLMKDSDCLCVGENDKVVTTKESADRIRRWSLDQITPVTSPVNSPLASNAISSPTASGSPAKSPTAAECSPSRRGSLLRKPVYHGGALAGTPENSQVTPASPMGPNRQRSITSGNEDFRVPERFRQGARASIVPAAEVRAAFHASATSTRNSGVDVEHQAQAQTAAALRV